MQAAVVSTSGAFASLLGSAGLAINHYVASTNSLPVTVALLIVSAFCLLLGCCCGLGWGFVLGLAAPRISSGLLVQIAQTAFAEATPQPRRRLAVRGRLH